MCTGHGKLKNKLSDLVISQFLEEGFEADDDVCERFSSLQLVGELKKIT